MNPSKNIITKEEAIVRLQDICSRAEKSISDIKKKLNDWGHGEIADRIISSLQKDKFIDSLRYARAFANDKYRFGKWGKIKIRYYLHAHQIPDTDITTALNNIPPDDYCKMVFDELMKKKKTFKISDPYYMKAKIFSFAKQRGYEGDLVSKFLGGDE